MDIQRLFESPDHYMLAFEGDQAIFAEMDRAAYERSIFLDGRISPKGPGFKTAVAPMVAHAAQQLAPAQLGYIFHVAHCGSTLLARAIDEPSSNLVLREPVPLRQLGVQGSTPATRSDAWRGQLNLALHMLSRRYIQNAPVIVKANVPVNFIADELLTRAPNAPAIVLYFPLDLYIQAILPAHTSWGHVIGRDLGAGVAAVCGPEPSDATLAVKVARLWAAQMQIYANLLQRFPNTASLDAETLFTAPGPTLSATFRLFAQSRTNAEIDAIVASDLFSRYSKKPDLAFDNATRLRRRQASALSLSPEIDEARAYVRGLNLALPDRLAKPLAGEPPLLLG